MGPGTHGPQPYLILSGFSHEVDTKSRVCDDLMPGAGTKAGQQCAGAGAQHRVAPVWRDLSQGHEHEGAPVRLGMGQNEPGAGMPAAG